jgi:hypothetical protein
MNDDADRALLAACHSIDAIVDPTCFPQLVWSFVPRVAANLRLGRVADAHADITVGLQIAERSGQRWAVFQLLTLTVGLLRDIGDSEAAEVIDRESIRFGGAAARPVFWRNLVQPLPLETMAQLSFSDADELLQFARDALSAAAVTER